VGVKEQGRIENVSGEKTFSPDQLSSLLSSKPGTCKVVMTKFWPRLSGESSENDSGRGTEGGMQDVGMRARFARPNPTPYTFNPTPSTLNPLP